MDIELSTQALDGSQNLSKMSYPVVFNFKILLQALHHNSEHTYSEHIYSGWLYSEWGF